MWGIFTPQLTAAAVPAGAWTLGAVHVAFYFLQGIFPATVLISVLISFLRWFLDPLYKLPKWVGKLEFVMNMLRFLRRQLYRLNCWFYALATLYSTFDWFSAKQAGSPGIVTWLIVNILCLPVTIWSVFCRGVKYTWFYIRTHKLRLFIVISVGAAAGAYWMRRKIKKESEKGDLEKLRLDQDRGGLTPESKNAIPAIWDLVQRLIFAGCAWVSILGVIKGAVDNTILRDVAQLFTLIARLLIFKDNSKGCRMSDPCCEFRNYPGKLVKNAYMCTCLCHEHKLEPDGTPVDVRVRDAADFAGMFSRTPAPAFLYGGAEGLRNPRAPVDGAGVGDPDARPLDDLDEQINVAQAAEIANVLADDDEEVKEVISIFTKIRRTIQNIIYLMWQKARSVEMVLVMAFVFGFIGGGIVYYYRPLLSRKVKALRDGAVNADTLPEIVEKVKASTVKPEGPDFIHPAMAPESKAKEVVVITSKDTQESRTNKNKKKKARIAQGDYKHTDLREKDLDRIEQMAREYEERYDSENEDVRLDNWQDAEEQRREREEEERYAEERWGDMGSYGVALTNKKANRKYESNTHRALSIPDAFKLIKPDAATSTMEWRKDAPIYTLETKGNVRLFAYDCPLCANKQQHRISSCPKNQPKRNWVFISKRAGYEPKIPIPNPDLFVTEMGYIYNKDVIALNAVANTIVYKGQQSKIEGVPIVDVENITNYITKAYDKSKNFQHCLIPIGNYLIGPFHGDIEGLQVEGPVEPKSHPDGWYPLERAQFGENEPAYWVGDDIVFYKKPQHIRSNQIGTIDFDTPQTVMLIGVHNNRLAVSGPRKLLNVVVKEGLSDLATIPVLAHDCSSDYGFSGGAIIDVATGRVIGMHLGTQQVGKRNYGVHLDTAKIREFITKPPTKKKKGVVPTPTTPSTLN